MAAESSVQLDHDRQIHARTYATLRRSASLIDQGLGAWYLLILALTGASLSVRHALDAALGSPILVVAGYVVAVFVVIVVATFPLAVLNGWTLAKRYSMSTQSFGAWLVDWLKGSGLGLAFTLVLVEALYALLAATPHWWWLVASALYVGFVVLLANLAPILIVPLFYKLTPLARSPLTDRLEALARELGFPVRGVYRMNLSTKTTAANAALMGLGNTRRIVIGDTLLDRFSQDEIEVVFAHELGHQVHHDVVRLIAVQAILTVASLFICSVVLGRVVGPLGYRGIWDVADLPLVVLLIGLVGTLSAPIGNALSRRFERGADQFALDTTEKPEVFVMAMTRLANQNLAEYDPERWVEVLFHDHPAIRRRIDFAEGFAARRSAVR